MKIISLNQPWATLVVLGHKKTVNLFWDTDYRGEILVHAPKAWSINQNIACCKEPFRSLLAEVAVFQQAKFREKCILPLGAILGKVTISEVKEKEGNGNAFFGLPPKEVPITGLRRDRFQWHFEDAVKFQTPIPAIGKLYMWEYNGHISQNYSSFNNI